MARSTKILYVPSTCFPTPTLHSITVQLDTCAILPDQSITYILYQLIALKRILTVYTLLSVVPTFGSNYEIALSNVFIYNDLFCLDFITKQFFTRSGEKICPPEHTVSFFTNSFCVHASTSI